MQDLPTRDEFEKCLRNTFRIRDGVVNPPDLELIEVSAPRVSAAPNGRPFSLLFRAPGSLVMPQRIYSLEHDGLGTLSIFLVPVGQDPAGMRYEAVFN